MMNGLSLVFLESYPGLATLAFAILLTVAYTISYVINSKKKPAYEKIGVSYDHNGDLLWICRSSEAKQVFTVRADTMNRAERRRTWTAGMDDSVSKHLRSLNR